MKSKKKMIILEHIHTLSQEALDHADLTVLTAVIGASALIKNSLWVYLRCVTVDWCPPRGDECGGSLKALSFLICLSIFIGSNYFQYPKYHISDCLQTIYRND